MSDLSFDIPAYDEAVANLYDKVIFGFVLLDPLHSWLGKGPLSRHAGPIRNIGGPNPLDQMMESVSVTNSIELSLIRNTDIEVYADMMYEAAHSMLRGLSSSFFKSLDEMFDHTVEKNKASVDEDEQMVGWDIILERLEKAPISFDEKGKPILPKLHSGTSEQKEYLLKTRSVEYEQRFWQIVDQKRNLYHAQKSARRLS